MVQIISEIVKIPNNGNPTTEYILEELKKIDSSYYDEFYGLINSIVKGTFKGVKRFTNNDVCNIK